MARLRLLENHEVDPELRAPLEANPTSRNEFTRILAHTPELYKAYLQFYRPLMADGRLDAKLKEMVRLKVAAINECNF